MSNVPNSSKKKSLIKRIVLLFSVLFVIAVLKVFVLEIVLISGGSMEGELHHGEVAWFSKIAYGPKWPERPIEIPFFNLLALNRSWQAWFTETEWKYRRWPKISSIKPDDVVLFTAHFYRDLKLVKRCVALPRDTIMMNQGRIYVNGIPYQEPLTTVLRYQIPSAAYKRSIPIWVRQKRSFTVGRDYFGVHLSTLEAKQLQEELGPDALTTFCSTQAGIGDSRCTVPEMVVPYKGQSFSRKELSSYEQLLLSIGSEINDLALEVATAPDTTFTVKQNYYFLLGDNRPISEDSRIWGFVPEDKIIGRLSFVIYPFEKLF